MTKIIVDCYIHSIIIIYLFIAHNLQKTCFRAAQMIGKIIHEIFDGVSAFSKVCGNFEKKG